MKALSRNSLSKFRVQIAACFSTSVGSKQQSKSKTTINDQEISHFTKLSDEWWDTVHGDLWTLHVLNPMRVKFIKDGLLNAGLNATTLSRPLEGVRILDVGCGGGILSESLAKQGAQVTGLDATKKLIDIAKAHASLDKNLASNLKYVHSTIEDFSMENKEQFDAVVSCEVLEHVDNQELFLKSCTEVLKPKGSIMVSTVNKTFTSWVCGIILAEYVLRIIPVGTHDWKKFISPEDTIKILEKYSCKIKLTRGFSFNPVTGRWSWIRSNALNFIIHAIKK